MSDHIREAAEELIQILSPKDPLNTLWTQEMQDGLVDSAADVIRAKLAAAVPEKVDPIHPHSKNCRCDDCGWNECRKAFLGGEE